jgi:hypothetical protein
LEYRVTNKERGQKPAHLDLTQAKRRHHALSGDCNTRALHVPNEGEREEQRENPPAN